MKRLTVAIVAILLGLAAAVYLNRDTWRLYVEQVQRKRQSDERMKRAEQERADLLQQRSKLESPSGREEQVRKEGFKRPGEVPLNEVR